MNLRLFVWFLGFGITCSGVWTRVIRLILGRYKVQADIEYYNAYQVNSCTFEAQPQTPKQADIKQIAKAAVFIDKAQILQQKFFTQ